MNTETREPVDAIGMKPSPIHLRNILVPLELSEMSLKSLQYAVPLAKQFGAKITLLHVLKAPSFGVDSAYLTSIGHQQIMVVEKRLDEIIPPELAVETVVRECAVLDAILEVARETQADLIVTTTHGYTGLKHLVAGSTAETVVRRAPCPVLVLREEEHDFFAPLKAPVAP